MRMTKNEWKALDDRLVRMIKNEVGAVAVKFIRTQEQLDAIDELVYWPKPASVCKAIGLAAYWKRTVAMTDKILNYHCGGNCGTYPHGELFEKGSKKIIDTTTCVDDFCTNRSNPVEMKPDYNRQKLSLPVRAANTASIAVNTTGKISDIRRFFFSC